MSPTRGSEHVYPGSPVSYPSPSSRDSTFGKMLDFQRRELDGNSVLMGKISRSYITGEISLLSTAGFPDFLIVDLAERQTRDLTRSERKTVGDRYLFKTAPLMYRTWIYHSLMRGKVVLGGKHEEKKMMKHVLAQNCIDVPINAGRGSSLPYYVPLALATCLLGNQIFVMFTLFIVWLLILVAYFTNTPPWYRLARVFTLPLRLALLIVLFVAMDPGDILDILGVVLTVCIFLVELVVGDLATLSGLRISATYEIIHDVDKRVSVCARHGAYTLEEKFGDRGKVHECVSGMPVWEKHHHLIADIGDYLVELQPLSPEDWSTLKLQYIKTGEPIPYLALNSIPLEAQAHYAARQAQARASTHLSLQRARSASPKGLGTGTIPMRGLQDSDRHRPEDIVVEDF